MERKRISRSEYYSYIRSSAWREVKDRYLKSKLSKDCYCCLKAAGTFSVEFHHRSYKRLGCERLSDIVPVCRECHQAIHDIEGSDLWRATNRIKGKQKKIRLRSEKRAARASAKAAAKKAVTATAVTAITQDRDQLDQQPDLQSRSD